VPPRSAQRSQAQRDPAPVVDLKDVLFSKVLQRP
jgi:hypothetical protein